MIDQKKKKRTANEINLQLRQISDSTYHGDKIEFSNLSIKEELSLSDINIRHPLVFKNCTITNIVFKTGGMSNVYFKDCKINQIQWDSAAYVDLTFHMCKIGIANIEGDARELIILGSKIDTLLIRSSIKLIKIGTYFTATYAGDKYEDVLVKTELDNFIFTITKAAKPMQLNVREAYINQIIIGGAINDNSSLNFNFCKISQVQIINLINNGKLLFSDIKVWQDPPREAPSNLRPKHMILISDSQLNMCSWENINFSDFESIKIRGTNLRQANFLNVKWSPIINRDIIRSANTKNKRKDEYRRAAEIYKQLALAHKRENDKIQQIRLNAFYLDSYRKSLDNNSHDISEKLLLWIGRWTNNFRLNWILPLGLIVFGSLPFFILMILIDPNLSLYYNWADYFKFLNPARSYSYISSADLSKAAIMVDFLGRVYVSLMIFQFIQAIRKHTWSN